MDERNQIPHVFVQLLPTDAGVLHLFADDIDCIVPVVVSGQQSAILWQKSTHSNFVELEDVFLSDRMGGITEELQALLHSVDTVFALVTGSIAGHDLPNTVSGEINIFNGKGGDDLLLHGLDAIKLRAVLPRQQNFCSREMDLGRAL